MATSHLGTSRKLHFVGIGGAGMSALAKVLLEEGYQVSGCDAALSPAIQDLRESGASIAFGHDASHVRDADLVVLTSAIPEGNPDCREARRLGIPIVKRSELLGELSARQPTIAVAGTHGKTTTTAMIATILEAAGSDPTILLGGEVPQLGGSAKRGKGRMLVVEADEFDRSFLHLSPTLAVITNIEPDHLDYFGNWGEVQQAFRQFAALVPPEGALVGCNDDATVRSLLNATPSRAITYGLSEGTEWRATDIVLSPQGSSCQVLHAGQGLGSLALQVPGRHNILNALAALGAAAWLDVDWEIARKALAEYRGARRRFERLGKAAGVSVVDDYAHHPTEVRATIAAARTLSPRRLWCLFQPHTHHRVRVFHREFAAALAEADHAVITAVYSPPGREPAHAEVNAERIVADMNGRRAVYIPDLDKAASWIVQRVEPGDLVLTMGAGDVYRGANLALQLLREREQRGQ